MRKWNRVIGSLICLVIALVVIQLILTRNSRESLDWEKISREIRSSLSKTEVKEEVKEKEATPEEKPAPFEKTKISLQS
jgi:type III secretory pathway component EscU